MSILNQKLENAFTRFADKPAFTCMGHTLTYHELDQLSAQFACYLQTCTDLQPGDRIALQMPNILQYPVALYGALRSGLIIVNTNPLYTPREIKFQLNDSGAKALVVLANIAEASSKVINETPVEHVIVTEIADLHPPAKRLIINAAVKYIKKMVPPFRYSQQIGFREVLRKGIAGDFKTPELNAHETALLQYTGGTTGVAKGAMLTQQNLAANFDQVKHHLGDSVIDGEGTFLAPLPLYHIYAFNLHCIGLADCGNHSLLIPNPRDINGLVKTLRNYRVNGFIGISTLFTALMNHPDFSKIDFSQLRVTASGGTSLPESIAAKWQEATGIEPAEGYGMTEASPAVATNPLGAIKRGTVGVALPDTEIKIIDEAGTVLPRGQEGELCVRGPQVMKGYWQRPEATAEVLDDQGWLKSGDIAVIGEDGYIRIVDRKKDMIIVSGFNVYPNEIEEIICQHPAVQEAAAIGVKDGKTGEAVKVFVVPKGKRVSEPELRQYCKGYLTAYKVPRHIVFCEELPKTNVGKVLRRELREQFNVSDAASVET